jgi:hypothetical protein
MKHGYTSRRDKARPATTAWSPNTATVCHDDDTLLPSRNVHS